MILEPRCENILQIVHAILNCESSEENILKFPSNLILVTFSLKKNLVQLLLSCENQVQIQDDLVL